MRCLVLVVVLGCGGDPGETQRIEAARGATVPRRAPVAAPRAPSSAPVIQLSAAGDVNTGDHACALHADGLVSCWGGNAVGQLGDPTTARLPGVRAERMVRTLPIGAPIDGVLEVATGAFRTCVRKTDGVWCWGAESYEPEKIGGTERAVQITDSCARYPGGEVRCWYETQSAELEPAFVDAVDVASSYLAQCVVRRSGAVTCWKPGSRAYDSHVIEGVVEVAPGVDMGCARTGAGAVWCWRNPDYAYDVSSLKPVRITGLEHATQITAGYGFACALDAGDVRCWGSHNDSRLYPPMRPQPTGIRAEELVGGYGFACARSGGDVTCWGDNSSGQLGIGWSDVHPEPIEVPGIDDAIDVHVGESWSCARRRSGQVTCWGRIGDFNERADSTPAVIAERALAITGARLVCVRVAGDVTCGDRRGLRRVKATPEARAADVVSCGPSHCSAVLADDTVWSWGSNAWGQYGNDTFGDIEFGSAAAGIIGAVGVVAGDETTCIVLRDGAVTCSGRSMRADRSVSLTLRRIAGIDLAITVALGQTFGCARIVDGSVRCWGQGGEGQLGRAGVKFSERADPVDGLADAVQIAGTTIAMCARGSDGSVRCWGSNDTGLLADPTTLASSATPVVIPIAGAVDISVGQHACAALATGKVVCWGASGQGQVGTLVSTYVEAKAAVRIAFRGRQ